MSDSPRRAPINVAPAKPRIEAAYLSTGGRAATQMEQSL